MARHISLKNALVFAAAAFAYLYPFPYFREMRNPNELLNLYTARALIEQGTFSLDGYVREYGKRTDLANSGGLLYSNKAPLLAMCAAGLYGWLKALGVGADARTLIWIFRFSFSIVPSLLFLLLLRRFLRNFVLDERCGRVLVLGYALGTPAFTYGVLFYTHQPASILLFAGFASAFHARKAGAFYHVLSGLLCGLAVACEYPSGIVAGLIFLYVLLGGGGAKGAGLFAFGAAPVAAALAAYHAAVFGSPFTTPYAHMEERASAAGFGRGFMGITYPKFQAIYGTLASPSRGILFYSPFLLAAFAGFRSWWKAGTMRAELWLCACACAALLLFNFSYNNWAGGWSLGPRHIIAIYPFMLLAAAAFLSSNSFASKPAVRVAFSCLVAVSIIVTSLSTAVYANSPPAYKNPFFEMALPLLRRGYFPYTPLYFLGIRGVAAAIPLFIVLAAVLFYVVYTRGESRRKTLIMTAAAAALSAGLLFLMSLPGGSAPKETERQDYLIEKMWEP